MSCVSYHWQMLADARRGCWAADDKVFVVVQTERVAESNGTALGGAGWRSGEPWAGHCRTQRQCHSVDRGRGAVAGDSPAPVQTAIACKLPTGTAAPARRPGAAERADQCAEDRWHPYHKGHPRAGTQDRNFLRNAFAGDATQLEGTLLHVRHLADGAAPRFFFMSNHVSLDEEDGCTVTDGGQNAVEGASTGWAPESTHSVTGVIDRMLWYHLVRRSSYCRGQRSSGMWRAIVPGTPGMRRSSL